MDQMTADLHRRVANMTVIGTIAEVDHDAARVRVDVNGRLTDWLRWPAEVGRNYRAWRPLRAGMQVVLSCPSGDPANACITSVMHTADLAPPSTDPDADLIQWEDGTTVSYHSGTRTLTISSPKTIAITADTITLDGQVIITGDGVTHNGRNIGDDHKHTDVKSGSSLTGPPNG